LRSASRALLLVCKVRVVDAVEASLVAVTEHSTELAAGGLNDVRNDERSITEIDDPHCATPFDTPAATQIGREAHLTVLGHLGRPHARHACIVRRGLGCSRRRVAVEEMAAVEPTQAQHRGPL